MKAAALVLWLWKVTHVREVVGLKPSTIYEMFNFSRLLFSEKFCLPNILISPCINLSMKQGHLNRFEGRSSACEWSN